MADIVRKMRAELLEEVEQWIDEALDCGESPIEQALLLAFLHSGNGVPTVQGGPLHGPGVPENTMGSWFRVIEGEGGCQYYEVMPQLPVEHSGKRYRIDIAIEWPFPIALRSPQNRIWLAVECDGHDFHERTREQAARDKERDRALQALGWYVARFTGREIVADPMAVVLDIEAFCDRVGWRVMEERGVAPKEP